MTVINIVIINEDEKYATDDDGYHHDHPLRQGLLTKDSQDNSTNNHDDTL